MKEKLIQYLNTATLTQSLLTSSATILNGALGMVFYILIGRILGPSDFGVLMFSIAVLVMLADIANLGTDTGLIRFIGKTNTTDKNIVLKFLKLTFEIRFLIWLVIVIIGVSLSPIIAQKILNKPEFTLPLQLVSVGVGGMLFFSFITSSLQALQHFWGWSLISIGLNFLRVVVIVSLFYLMLLTTTVTLVIYISLPFLFFLIGLVMLPNFLKIKGETSVAKEFFHYNKWVAIFVLLAAISSRVDTFIIGKLLSNYDLGIYSAANQLVSVIPQLVLAIAVVVAPKLASFDNHQKALIYLKKLQILVTIICLIGILLSPLAYFIVPALFGSEYLESINIFMILYFAQLIFLFSLPAHQSIFYYFGKPLLFVWIALIHLLIVSLGGWYMVSNFGLIGAAYTVLIGMISNFIIPAIWVINKFGLESKNKYV